MAGSSERREDINFKFGLKCFIYVFQPFNRGLLMRITYRDLIREKVLYVVNLAVFTKSKALTLNPTAFCMLLMYVDVMCVGQYMTF